MLLKEKFYLVIYKDETLTKNKKIKKDENYFIIDENQIKNNLFEAWKEFENLGSKISEFKSKLLGDKKNPKKKNIFGEEIAEKEKSTNKEKDFGKVSGDATNRVVSRRLNMGLNSKQIKSLDKLNMFCGVNKNGEENIKKVANITSKLEGGARNKLMSFMQNDDSINSLEGFSKRANEKDRKMNEKEEKEKKEEKNEKNGNEKNENEKNENEKNENEKDKEKKQEMKENKENNEKEKEVQNNENKKEEIKKENEENKINNIELKKETEIKKEEKNDNQENKEGKQKEKDEEKDNKKEKENETKKENETEKGNKSKRPKKGLRALRGLDI
jgi:hypothetical protein